MIEIEQIGLAALMFGCYFLGFLVGISLRRDKK